MGAAGHTTSNVVLFGLGVYFATDFVTEFVLVIPTQCKGAVAPVFRCTVQWDERGSHCCGAITSIRSQKTFHLANRRF